MKLLEPWFECFFSEPWFENLNWGLRNGLHICSIYTTADIQLITFLQLYVSVEQIVVS